MPPVILMLMKTLCKSCANGPTNYINLNKIRMFASKKKLFEYFDQTFQIDNSAESYADDIVDTKHYDNEEQKIQDKQLEKTKIIDKYYEVLNNNFNWGIKLTGEYCDCKACGKVYIYGNYKEMSNIDFEVSEYTFANIRQVFGNPESDSEN